MSKPASSPHRPYEGSQRELDERKSPLRRRPHRPYEGSQRLPLLPRDARHAPVLIAPTRGRNVIAWRRPTFRCSRSSSPLRGVATTRQARPGGRHRRSSSPLRGVATRCRHSRGTRQRRRVLIASTRGRNPEVRTWLEHLAPVLIAPTRGHNGSSSASGGQYHIVLMALRWVATESQLASISLPDW